MKRTSLLASVLCGLLLAAPALAGVSINVGLGIPIPVPVVVVPAPPQVVVIPGTPVYYAPGLNVDVFFYSGYWWTPYQGYWYRSPYYSGPWAYAPAPPRVFLHLPPHYREMSRVQPHIPYGQFHDHWRDWEGERRNPRWDKGGWKRDRDHGGDRGYYRDRGYRNDRGSRNDRHRGDD